MAVPGRSIAVRRNGFGGLSGRPVPRESNKMEYAFISGIPHVAGVINRS